MRSSCGLNAFTWFFLLLHLDGVLCVSRHRRTASISGNNVAGKAASSVSKKSPCLGTPNDPCPVDEPTHWLIEYVDSRVCPPPGGSERVCQPIYADGTCHEHTDSDDETTYVLATRGAYGTSISMSAGTDEETCGCMSGQASVFDVDTCVDNGETEGTSVKLVSAEEYAATYDGSCEDETSDVLDGALCGASFLQAGTNFLQRQEIPQLALGRNCSIANVVDEKAARAAAQKASCARSSAARARREKAAKTEEASRAKKN